MAALTAATAHMHAVEQAAYVVAQERDAAAAAAAEAAAAVVALVADIVEADARALAVEEKGAFENYWRIRDRLSGYARTEPTKLADIGDDIAKGLNRQARLARENPLFLESPRWLNHLNQIATESEKAWRNYGQRLANDAAAKFEESRS